MTVLTDREAPANIGHRWLSAVDGARHCEVAGDEGVTDDCEDVNNAKVEHYIKYPLSRAG